MYNSSFNGVNKIFCKYKKNLQDFIDIKESMVIKVNEEFVV